MESVGITPAVWEPRIVSAVMYDLGIIHTHAEPLAESEAQSDAHAVNPEPGLLAGLDEVSRQIRRVVKSQKSQAPAFETDFARDIRRDELDRGLMAFVVRINAFVKSAHAVRAADAELLTGHQGVAGGLRIRGHTHAPVGRQ